MGKTAEQTTEQMTLASLVEHAPTLKDAFDILLSQDISLKLWAIGRHAAFLERDGFNIVQTAKDYAVITYINTEKKDTREQALHPYGSKVLYRVEQEELLNARDPVIRITSVK